MNNAVFDDDSQTDRRPIILLKGFENLVANLIVVSGRTRNIVSYYRDGLHQIRSRDNSDQSIFVYDRHSLDIVLLHKLDDLPERGVPCNSAESCGHDLPHLAAPLVDVLRCSLARTDK